MRHMYVYIRIVCVLHTLQKLYDLFQLSSHPSREEITLLMLVFRVFENEIGFQVRGMSGDRGRGVSEGWGCRRNFQEFPGSPEISIHCSVGESLGTKTDINLQMYSAFEHRDN